MSEFGRLRELLSDYSEQSWTEIIKLLNKWEGPNFQIALDYTIGHAKERAFDDKTLHWRAGYLPHIRPELRNSIESYTLSNKEQRIKHIDWTADFLPFLKKLTVRPSGYEAETMMTRVVDNQMTDLEEIVILNSDQTFLWTALMPSMESMTNLKTLRIEKPLVHDDGFHSTMAGQVHRFLMSLTSVETLGVVGLGVDSLKALGSLPSLKRLEVGILHGDEIISEDLTGTFINDFPQLTHISLGVRPYSTGRSSPYWDNAKIREARPNLSIQLERG